MCRPIRLASSKSVDVSYVGRAPSWGHQAEGVHNNTSVLDTPVLQAINDNSPDAHRPVCCGNTEKLTHVSACPFEAADDLVAFRNLLLDGEDNVGKACAHGAKDIFQ